MHGNIIIRAGSCAVTAFDTVNAWSDEKKKNRAWSSLCEHES